MASCRLLSVRETYWDPDALACEQTSGWGINEDTIRISIDLKSTVTITKFDRGMRQIGSVVVFNDLDIDNLLQYLQEVKQHLSEKELVDKLTGRK